jgi:hypothetical protein
MSKKSDLKKFLEGRTSIGPKGLEKFKEQYGYSGGVKPLLGSLGATYKGSSSSSSSAQLPEYGAFGSFEGFSPFELEAGLSLEQIGLQGDIQKKITQMNNRASRKIQKSINRANIKVAEIDERKEKAVQEIVNAGARDVENIRGTYGLKGKAIDRGTSLYTGLVNAFSFS